LVTPELEPDWQLLSDILLPDRECPSAVDVLARLHAIEKRQAAAAAAATAGSENCVAVAAAPGKENQVAGKPLSAKPAAGQPLALAATQPVSQARQLMA
jgi:hypothetical protein